MTKGLHKNSLRKGEPNKWIVEDIIEKLKAEVERLKEENNNIRCDSNKAYCQGYGDAFVDLLSVLSDLESEKPINSDDAMKALDEKIALVKQRGTWDGVDVNKYIDEVRCRESEKPVPTDLEEAADNHIRGVADAVKRRGWELETQDITDAFIAGAKWQEEQDLKYISEIHRNGYNLCKEQMMNKAMEGEVVKDISNKLAVTAKINLDGFKFGDKVRIIIVKED